MLTNNDTKIIEEIATKAATKSVKEGLMDFWDTVLEPYLTRQHEENKKEKISTEKQFEHVAEDIRDHEKRLRTLEAS